MLDRDVGLVPALDASLRVTRANPLAVAFWGLIVAVALVLGSLPLFFGLAVVVPVLGHATWRLYRKAIERDPAHEVPIESPLNPDDVTENPVVRFVWIFLDMLDFLREGKEPTDPPHDRRAEIERDESRAGRRPLSAAGALAVTASADPRRDRWRSWESAPGTQHGQKCRSCRASGRRTRRRRGRT